MRQGYGFQSGVDARDPMHDCGVGAIIGAGIFVATGAAAHNVAGPALMLSYVVAGVTCVFAALCYAEFGSSPLNRGEARL